MQIVCQTNTRHEESGSDQKIDTDAPKEARDGLFPKRLARLTACRRSRHFAGNGPRRSLVDAERTSPIAARGHHAAADQIEEREDELRFGAALAGIVQDALLEAPEAPFLEMGRSFDANRLAEPELAPEPGVEIENDRGDAAGEHLSQPETRRSNPLPPRLFEELEITGVVYMAEAIEMALADDRFVDM